MTQRRFLDTLLPLQPTMRMVAERLLGNKEEAADAVQETYARLWEQRQKVAKHVAPEAYAMQTLKNLCISMLRQRKRAFPRPLRYRPQRHAGTLLPEGDAVRTEHR